MIKVNNEIYRNIQEQVQANKEAIEAFSSVEYTLNNFGIKVLGVRADAPTGTNFEFGDAYLVGNVAPFNMYIFTRNDDPTVAGTWINIGNINLVGEAGPTGPAGPAGSDGYAPVVRYGNGIPVAETTDKNGYLYIDQQTGKIYTYNNGWVFIVNLTGPKGNTGATGPQGTTNGTVSLVGRLLSPSLLPTNFETGAIPKNSAYLIDVDGVNHLYVILGEQAYSTWYWYDTGEFALGSILYKDTEYQAYANITDDYTGATGSLLTDTGASELYDDIMTDMADKVSESTFNTAIQAKADKSTVDTLSGTVSGISTNLSTNYDTASTADGKYVKLNGGTGFQTIATSYAGGDVMKLDNTSSSTNVWLGFAKNGTNCGTYGVQVSDGTPRYYNNKTSRGSEIITSDSIGNYPSGGMDLLYDGNSTNHVIGTKYDTSKSLTNLSKYHMLAFDIRCGGNESYRSELHFCKVPTATTTNVSSYAYTGTLSTAFTLSIVSSVALTQQMLVYYGVETSTNTLKFIINRLNQLTKSSSADSFTTKTDGNSGDYIRIYGVY